MKAFIEGLAKQRRELREALEANKGDINLGIFEDFYPDKAHFVFELLQNAEDACATEVTITLAENSCSFEHNGTRIFDEADVKSITGINNSTKSEDPDKIGKFGVGFKSVFAYTRTPIVRSRDYSFKILDFIEPEWIDQDSTFGTNTHFEFPFNNPKKAPEDAQAEIKAGLSELAETTLLFLSHLESICWQVDQTTFGKVLRIQHPNNHFEVLKQVDEKMTTSSHFLKFDQPVLGLKKQTVAVAYALDFLPNVHSFDSKKPLAKQLKIVPASPGHVAVFFPAKKESSGLRFHLHAPFIPELSRASIKETPDNEPLFQQLATLAATSLHSVRDLGLLSAEFLGILPNPKDPLTDRYEQIRLAIVEAMNTEPLTPTHSKSHAPAEHLLQAKTSLKKLLSKDDLDFLVEEHGETMQWATAQALQGTNIERFMTGLAINDWDIEQFVETIEDKAYLIYPWSEPDDAFLDWLASKSVEWHQQLYALLYKEFKDELDELYRLNTVQIVRLTDGNYGIGEKSFFPGDHLDINETFPLVDVDVFTSGKNKATKENAKRFLEAIGVRKVGETEQIEAILEQRYTKEAESPDEKTYRKDLKRFIALVEQEPETAALFANYYIFECIDGEWGIPSSVFLDKPFLDTGLAAYFNAIGNSAEEFALAENYQNCSVTHESLAKFAEAVGTKTKLDISKARCSSNPEWAYLLNVGGIRYTSPINRDFEILFLEKLLKTPSLDLSKLIWRTMTSLPEDRSYFIATFSRNASSGSRQAASQLIHCLRSSKWIPQGCERYVRPADANRDLLPEGFPFDPGWSWIKEIKFGEEIAKQPAEHTQKLATEMGFADTESLERAKLFGALPKEVQERCLAELEPRDTSELPENNPKDPERRLERVVEWATEAPERHTVILPRSISVNREAVKNNEATQYLCQQYTKPDGKMFCQVCQEPLPFKLDDGSYFFETVEFQTGLKNHHFQNYLALCPNHSAMFRYANTSRKRMAEMFDNLDGNELKVVLAQQDASIYFTGTHIADLKPIIETDTADIQGNDHRSDTSDDDTGE